MYTKQASPNKLTYFLSFLTSIILKIDEARINVDTSRVLHEPSRLEWQRFNIDCSVSTSLPSRLDEDSRVSDGYFSWPMCSASYRGVDTELSSLSNDDAALALLYSTHVIYQHSAEVSENQNSMSYINRIRDESNIREREEWKEKRVGYKVRNKR